MDEPVDLAAHFDLLNEDDIRNFGLLRQRVLASQNENNDNASTSSSNSSYGSYQHPWGRHIWLHWQEEITVMFLRRICYILRQNTLMKTLRITGYNGYLSDSYYDERRVCGLLPCVGIQYNQSIEDLSLENIRLGSFENFDKVHVFGTFLRDNPSLRKLKLYNCCLDKYDLDWLAWYMKKRSVNSIESIEFSHNHIGNDNDENKGYGPLDLLVEALKKNTSVKRLDLSYNHIGDKGSILGKVLKREDCKLEELSLGGNELGTESVSLLLQSIRGDNNTLKTVNLGSGYDSSAVLQFISNGSSIASTIDSNHTISSVGAPMTREREMNRRYRQRGQPTSLLTATLNVNYQYTSTQLKVRQKVIWNHVMRNYNIGGDDTIPIAAMPRVLSFIAYDSGCNSCRTTNGCHLQYQDQPRHIPSQSELDRVRLDAIFRIMVVRPELCSDNSSGAVNAYHRLSQQEVRRLRLENERLRLEINRLLHLGA